MLNSIDDDDALLLLDPEFDGDEDGSEWSSSPTHTNVKPSLDSRTEFE
jgi:hypothetical protein